VQTNLDRLIPTAIGHGSATSGPWRAERDLSGYVSVYRGTLIRFRYEFGSGEVHLIATDWGTAKEKAAIRKMLDGLEVHGLAPSSFIL
jgi:hypothetical protein